MVMGHVDHSQRKYLELGLTTYLNYSGDSLAIDPKGNFSGRFPMEGGVQELSLRFRDTSLNIYVQSGDTIDVRWNDTAVARGIFVRNMDPGHDRGLQAVLLLRKLYSNEYMGLNAALFTKGQSDSAKFARVNDFFTRQMTTLSAQNLDSFAFRKLGADIYYECTRSLLFARLLPEYSLKAEGYSYLTLSEEDFHNSYDYRNFLFDYLRVGRRLLNGFRMEGTPEERKAKLVRFSAPLDDYYDALANVKIYEVRDWFITSSIMFDFEEYGFDDAVQVYQDFITKVRVGDYADTLRSFYAAEQRLKPGASAPGFTLTDEYGRTVSLRDFRGNVVMIDFWGVGCGPCMNDIRENLPPIHDKYKDKKVVFLNICVDSETDAWKKCLAGAHLTGVNLLAMGWTRNPVCQAYGINVIPHYCLIDAEGKMAVNNLMMPDMVNKIDAALSKVTGR